MGKEGLSVKERLASLETLIVENNKRSDERWDAHDKRSDENWDKVSKTLDDTNSFIKGEGKRKEACMKEAREYTEKHTSKTISLALGVPASVCSVIGLIVWIHKILIK